MKSSPASFKRRLLATFIDALILGACSFALLYFWSSPKEFSAIISNDTGLPTNKKEAFINYVLPIFITIFFWLKFLGTPGKLLLDCKVVDARTLKKMSIGQSILRYFAYIVSALPLCLGFLWVIWDKNKQSFHDKIAKTLVIKEDEIESLLNEDNSKDFEA